MTDRQTDRRKTRHAEFISASHGRSRIRSRIVVRDDRRVAFGFTLAEVLITLGIIGVVAAMTIPNLVKYNQKLETISRLKSTYTILNNAIEIAKVDNGSDINNWYIPADSKTMSTDYFARTYLLPYLKTSKICGASTSSDCRLQIGILKNLTSSTKSYFYLSGDSTTFSFQLKNGAIVQVINAGTLKTSVGETRIEIRFDINGAEKPNINGKDVFLIELGGSQSEINKNKFLPYFYNTDRPTLLGVGISGDNAYCNKYSGNGSACFALIVKDGWQIKDDYPW